MLQTEYEFRVRTIYQTTPSEVVSDWTADGIKVQTKDRMGPTLAPADMKVVRAVLTPTFTNGDPLNIYWRNTSRATSEAWPAKGSPKQTVGSPTSGAGVTVHGLKPDSTYEFRVTVTIAGTETAYSTTVTGTTGPAVVPTNLAATGTTIASVTLQWSAVADASEYNVQYSSDAGDQLEYEE